MRPQHHEHALLFVALALAGCRNDSIGTLPSEPRPSLLASRHAAGDPPRFSDWSTAVHLDAPINSCAKTRPQLSHGTSSHCTSYRTDKVGSATTRRTVARIPSTSGSPGAPPA